MLSGTADDAVSDSASSASSARGDGAPRVNLRDFARKRMQGVQEKLVGGNSARVTMHELRLHSTYAKADATFPGVAAFDKVVLGPPDCLRRKLPETGLTPEEQVDVLVEHATDPAVLGFCWLGWKPWL